MLKRDREAAAEGLRLELEDERARVRVKIEQLAEAQAQAAAQSSKFHAAFEQKEAETADLRRRLEHLSESVECPFCFERPATIAFDCGHVYCNTEACGSSRVTECPSCRQTITKRTKIYGALSEVSQVLSDIPEHRNVAELATEAKERENEGVKLLQARLNAALQETAALQAQKDQLAMQLQQKKEAEKAALQAQTDQIVKQFQKEPAKEELCVNLPTKPTEVIVLDDSDDGEPIEVDDDDDVEMLDVTNMHPKPGPSGHIGPSPPSQPHALNEDDDNTNSKNNNTHASTGTGSGEQSLFGESRLLQPTEADGTDPMKRARGRPKGRKDSKPRARNSPGAPKSAAQPPAATQARYPPAEAHGGAANFALADAAAGLAEPPRPEQQRPRQQPHALGANANRSPQRPPPASPRAHLPDPSSLISPSSKSGRLDASASRSLDASAGSGPGSAGAASAAAAAPDRVFALPPKETWGQVYGDLRPWIARTLFRLAQSKAGRSCSEAVFHTHVRALVRVAMHPRPICKLDAARKIPEVGDATVQALKEALLGASQAGVPPPAEGLFATTAAAALVGLHDFAEEHQGAGAACPLEELLRRTRVRMDPRFPGCELRSENVADAGWMQVKKLMGSAAGSGALIKERKRNGESCYELQDAGAAAARTLLERQWSTDSQGPYAQLQSVDGRAAAECGEVVMVVDFREGRGMAHSLFWEMCDRLDFARTPFFVRSLAVGDYMFLCQDGRVAPVLVERKTAEDLALSIVDGRWQQQQESMLRAQRALGRKMRLVYIVEGDRASRSLARGTTYVGRAEWGVTLEAVKEHLERLEARGFEVMRTSSLADTVRRLRQVHVALAGEASSGGLDKCPSVVEFESRFKATPADMSVHATHAAGSTSSAGNAAAARSPASSPTGRRDTEEREVGDAGRTSEDLHSALMKLTLAELKAKCEQLGEAISGTKADLVERILGPRKPQLWIDRKRAKQYVPHVDSANCALLVALLLCDPLHTQGLVQRELMDEAEALGISKFPMHAEKRYGAICYDGWSNHMELINSNLMKQKRVNKGSALYFLTDDGAALAEAMHRWTHRENLCSCGTHVEEPE